MILLVIIPNCNYQTNSCFVILSKIIVLINKDDYLLSLRGSDGGYKLSQEPRKYKVYDIIQKAEGDITISSCLNANFECCKRAKCRSYKLWNELNSVIIDFLESKIRTAIFNLQKSIND